MSLTYDETALTLVNTAERIAVQRVDIFGDPAHSTVATKGESWAYAWEQGKTLQQMERVVWKQVDTVTAGSQKIPVMKWVKLDSINWKTGNNVWDSSTQSWTNY